MALMTLTGDDLVPYRQMARRLRDAAAPGPHGIAQIGTQDAAHMAECVDLLVAEVERLRAELDLHGAGCATVIRCGETIRIVGPDGRGVFATINARMMESPPVDPSARMLKAVRRAMVAARSHSPHAIRARGVDGALQDVVQIPLGEWHEIEAAARASEAAGQEEVPNA